MKRYATKAFKTEGIKRPWTAVAKTSLGWSVYGDGETKKEAIANANKVRDESPAYLGAMR